MNPKVTRSSLDTLIVNTLKNITGKEWDPLPVPFFIFGSLYIYFFQFCPVGFFQWTSKNEPYDFSSVRGKSFVAALCWIALPELVVYATVYEKGHILPPEIGEIVCWVNRFWIWDKSDCALFFFFLIWGKWAYCWNIFKKKRNLNWITSKNIPTIAQPKSNSVECIKLLGSFVLQL